MSAETSFERPRGISSVETRVGFAQVRVGGITDVEGLEQALSAIAGAGVSIDFVKLTPDGFSFLCSEPDADRASASLGHSERVSVLGRRSLVATHAVNMRDEAGLLAKLMSEAIHTGAVIDHVADMHDRLLLVVEDSQAEALAAALSALRTSPESPRFVSNMPEVVVPESKGIKVMKFGGTSVATPKNRALAAMRVVSAKEQGFLPVVVVSAIGRRGEPYATDTLVSMLRDIDPNVDPDPREMDLLAGCGEILSAVIFAHTLKTLGHSAQSFRGGQAGIRTDGVYGNARVVGINPVSLFRSLAQGKTPVVCGFQGVWVPGDGSPGGELTTLGRGGSDTTASALGAAMGAVAVEIFTDVEGVKTADPDFVADAPTLRRVTYDELAEIAHLGAKVVHPRAAEIAMNFGIPLWVKSTFSDDPGTEIVSRESFEGRRFTGVAHTGKLVYLDFGVSELPTDHRRFLATQVMDALANFSVGLYMVNASDEAIGFGVSREQFAVVREVLDGLVVPMEGEQVVYLFQMGDASPEVETQARLLTSFGETRRVRVRVTEGCTMVSVVGQDAMKQPGVYLTAVRALAEAKVPMLQSSDSDSCISCLIPESELRRAVKALHDCFHLAESR